jgi:Carboxypeptidase regulatory-like domain
LNNESGQGASVPAAQSGAINGTVMDVQDEIVPGATVVLEGALPADYRKIAADDAGSFVFKGLRPGVTYHITVQADGFVDWKSPAIVLSPGQFQFVTNIQLQLKGEQTSVKVYASPEELATEQVKIAEQQRVFGIVPNFYVVYDSANAAPLTAKLKYKLALKVSFDPITIAGVLFMAGINQGSRIPDYPLGMKGYGERVGAVAADGFSDIMIGGAILPSLLHQDPRYYYQGTGTNRSRFLHAISYPFICRGDNGRLQPNYSTIGGDMASTALANLYYPRSDRTASFAVKEVMIGTAERATSSLLQEFVLRRFTSQSRSKN